MDLMKWIKSLDDFLFELMSWLVFWPLTMARAAIRPLVMMRYADAQLMRPEDEQYDEALSPPVFLILTLVIAYFSGRALGQPDAIVSNQHGMASLITNDTAAIGVRLVMYAAFPLIFTVMSLVARRHPVTRSNLQAPFYAQCYPAAVFAATLGVAAQASIFGVGSYQLPAIIILLAMIWLFATETLWFHRDYGFGWLSGLALALGGMIAGLAIVVLAAVLFLT